MTEQKKKEKATLSNKFDYILDTYISGAEAQKAFGYEYPSYITRLRDPKHTATLNALHIQLLEYVYGIPKEVFDSKLEFDTELIDKLVKAHQQKQSAKEEKNSSICKGLKENKIFSNNDKLFKNLKGIWYAYMYPSNLKSAQEDKGVWIVETTIYDDHTVVDEYNNKGILQMSDNQSLIIKKSNHDDLTIIRFQNRQVDYGIFRFVIVSTQNGSENEMVNFGFYSREKYTPEVAKELLGDISHVQMKLDLEFNDRIINKVVIK